MWVGPKMFILLWISKQEGVDVISHIVLKERNNTVFIETYLVTLVRAMRFTAPGDECQSPNSDFWRSCANC